MKTPNTKTDASPRRIKRYTRDAAFDKRDDRLEAWRDQFGLVRWVAVGIDPNRS